MSKVFEIITQRITEKLEKGVVPWEKPWNSAGLPKNLVSGRHYRGVNVFTLALEEFASPWWLTRKQAEELGGAVKENQRYTPCVYWFFKEEKASEGEEGEQSTATRRRGVLRFYQVYNVEQCDGIEVPQEERREISPIQSCEDLVASYRGRPEIRHGGDKACYIPLQDMIRMPGKNQFKGAERYYSTLFHELVHSTGHRKRLDRSTLVDMCPFGSTNYSKEELVAELGASYLCGLAGIENGTLDNSAAYIQGWLKALNDDKKLLVHAAGAAQKAVDLISGKLAPGRNPQEAKSHA